MVSFPNYAEILISGYGEKRESALLRTDMESGPAKQAKIKSRVMVERSATILLKSRSDYIAFVAWFSAELGEGAAWFDFNDCVTGEAKQARFVGGGIDASPAGSLDAWTISAKIETWG